MRKKSYAYRIMYPYPMFKKGGYLDRYLMAGGGDIPAMTSLDMSAAYMPKATGTMSKVNNPYPSNGSNINLGNVAQGAIGGLTNAAQTYASTGSFGSAASGLVDTAIKSIPVAGQIVSAVDAVIDPIAGAIGGAAGGDKYNQTLERALNPLNSLESGISNLIDGNSKEGWTDLASVVLPGIGGVADAKAYKETQGKINAEERQLSYNRTRAKDLNQGRGGNFWNQNQMMQAAYGGSLPGPGVIGESYAKGGYIERYGATRADLPQISNYNSGINTLEDGGELQMQQQPKGSMITEYDNDMTHGENPQGGTPVDSQGNRAITSNKRPVALVESGEVSFFDKKSGKSYVFSNRLIYK